MQLARGEHELAAKAQDIAGLTMTEAVKLLSDLRPPDPKPPKPQRQSRGRRGGDPIEAALKNGQALNIVERAWAECSDNERSLLLRKWNGGH
jgi:hypothetical protein